MQLCSSLSILWHCLSLGLEWKLTSSSPVAAAEFSKFADILSVKSWLIWKDPDVGKGWGQEEKRMAEDETVGWYLWLNRHGFGWTLGVGDGQGGLVCCGSWGHKELEMTEWLNWTELTQSQDTQGEWQGKDQGEPMTLFPCESKDLTRRRTYGVVSFGRLASSRPRMSQRFSSNPKTGKSQCPILKAVK